MTKHTPGPYRVVECHEQGIFNGSYFVEADDPNSPGEQVIICRLPTGGRNSVQYANARLIVAAPEMYEALLEAVLIARAYRSLCCKQFGAQPAGLDESMQMISHALAKVNQS